VVLGNNPNEKLGTLTDSAHARTVRATTTDRLALGTDHPRGTFGLQHMHPAFWVKVDEPKAYELNLM
jgi:hypothetical protein